LSKTLGIIELLEEVANVSFVERAGWLVLEVYFEVNLKGYRM
jgi:hypothetical protein